MDIYVKKKIISMGGEMMVSRKRLLTMKAIVNFLKKEFAIDKNIKVIQDQRKKPQISTGTIFKSELYATILGKGKAFLQMDQILREPILAKLISKKEHTPSDTTMTRVSKIIDTETLRQFNFNLLKKYLSTRKFKPEIKLPSGKKRLLGVVDGTKQSKRWYSVFGLINKFGINLIDVMPYSKRGKELPSSRHLMKRLYSELGFGFIDILVVDNLYATQNFINHSLAHNVDCVVKLGRDKGYVITKEAERLFSNAYDIKKHKVNHIKNYIDLKRNRKYEIFSITGLHFNNVMKPVKLLKVIEKELGDDGNNEPYIFYLLSTDIDLDDIDMLEIFHLRWHIENNGFKLSNAAANTKRTSIKDETVALNTLLIKFLAVFVLNLYYYANNIESVIRSFRHNVKVTITTYFTTLLCGSIIDVP